MHIYLPSISQPLPFPELFKNKCSPKYFETLKKRNIVRKYLNHGEEQMKERKKKKRLARRKSKPPMVLWNKYSLHRIVTCFQYKSLEIDTSEKLQLVVIITASARIRTLPLVLRSEGLLLHADP